MHLRLFLSLLPLLACPLPAAAETGTSAYYADRALIPSTPATAFAHIGLGNNIISWIRSTTWSR